MTADNQGTPRITIVGTCASGKSTLRRALRMHGYNASVTAQEHSAVPALWARTNPDVVIVLQADLDAVRLRRNNPRWSAKVWSAQQERLADAIGHANLVTDTSSISVDQVVNQVLEFLADFVQDSAHDR